jgi:hypothetical protein
MLSEYAASALVGRNTATIPNTITIVKAVDINFLNFIFFYLLPYNRVPISLKMDITNVIIFVTRLPNRITTNAITSIATIVPSMVIKFLPIE